MGTMRPQNILAALILSQLLVAAAFAQSAEFGHVSAGLLDVTPKRTLPLSGSLAITSSRSLGLGATLGGTLVKDRVWFFASGEKTDSLFRAAVPTRATDLTALFSTTRPSAVGTRLTIPSSFLSLHYTGIVSSTSFFRADFSQVRH